MRYTCDFETVNDPMDCRVWLAGIYNIETEFFDYFRNIDSFMHYIFQNIESDDTLYFHNLTFDGDFICYWLLKNGYTFEKDKRKLKVNQFSMLMSEQGIMYSMDICIPRYKRKVHIHIRDSLRLLPFKVSELSKAFDIPELKGTIDYNKYRPVNYMPTKREVAYLKNDCLIVGKSLAKAHEYSIDKLTIGSSALHKYEDIIGGKKKFRYTFPVPEYDGDIRLAYKGGWTYCNPKYQGLIIGKGQVFDVNSLYPYVLREMPMPYGNPKYKSGKPVKDKDYPLFVTSLYCSFEIKTNHLPTIQLKKNLYFNPTQYLTSSNGEVVNLTLTNIDLDLLFEHYDVSEITWCGTYYFKSQKGLFSEYIDFYTDLKIQADKDGNKALRTLCKLMLNNLYGKFSINPKVMSKYPELIDGQVKYLNNDIETREPLYIPVGIFTTSYARNITIRAAQANYDRFLYSDTDSVHLKGLEPPVGMNVDPYRLGAWKQETVFKKAKFLRAKTYLEQDAETGEIAVTCCGMPDTCYSQVTFDNFNFGVEYKGKLQKKRVQGGTVLSETTFKLKGVNVSRETLKNS